MKLKLPATLVMPLSVAMLTIFSTAQAGSIQIGDFRLSSGAYSSDTDIDPGSSDSTRSVIGAPVQVNSTFTSGTQNANGTADSNDLELRTFSSVTRLKTLSRFTPSVNGTSGANRVGMVQWDFDLTPLDSYLTSNSLSLTALDLDLITTHSDTNKKLDIYLSYTNPAESIAIASIDMSTVGDSAGDGGAGSNNWTNFYFPARSVSAGSVAGGTHKVLLKDNTGNLGLNESLLALYNSGVRDINLSIAAGDFWSGRTISVAAGSGLSIDTAPIPEPSTCVLLTLACMAALGTRRRG